MKYDDILLHLKSTQKEFKSMPTNLLCLKPSKEYIDADIKVMIFGQETNDWEGKFLHTGGVHHLQNVYDGFFNGGACYKYGGQFWNGFKKLKESLTREYKNENKSIEFLWNNIIKIGKSGEKGSPTEDVLEWSKQTFDLVRMEVEHYKPDVIVFFTGPTYNKFIKIAFPDAIFEKCSGKDSREIAFVKSKYLPQKSIRTYHPGYLFRKGFDDYLEIIVSQIRS